MNIPAKRRLGELLVDAGIIDETQLKAALGHQRQWGVRLGQAIVDLKLATEHEVVKMLARKYGFEVARLDQLEAYAHQQAVELVPREFAVKHNAFPLGADTSTLSVAMSDPSNLAVVDELRFRSGRRVKVYIGGDHEIANAIQAAYPSPDGAVEAIDLDIDDGAAPGEPVLSSFGGGSSADFDSFFGADARGESAAPDPFAADPQPAPAPSAGSSAAVPAFPVSLEAHAAPAPGGPAPRAPGPAPAAPAPRAPAAAPPAARAPAPAPHPSPAPPSHPAPVAPRTAPAPAQRAAQPAPVPAPGGRAAAPTAPGAPAARTAPAQQPAPRAAPTSAPAPQPRPAPAELELELPSADALRDARTRSAPPAPLAPAPGAPATARPAPAAPAAGAPAETEEELTPLSEDVEFTGSLPLAPRGATAPGAPHPGAAAQGAAPASHPAPGHAAAARPGAGLPAPAAAPTGPAALAYAPAEVAVLNALARLAEGGRAEPEVLKPTRLVAVLARLLVEKGILTERELLDALLTLTPGDD